MRTIKQSTQFKKDLKLQRKKPKFKQTSDALGVVIDLLQHDKPLPEKYKDHQLVGSLKGLRDCHVKPDLVLLYEQTDDGKLMLVRLGSHSDLFK